MRKLAILMGGVAVGVVVVLAGCQSQRTSAKGPLIVAPADCVDVNFPIYFEPKSAAVTREADQLIADAAVRSRGCDVTGIVVVGLAANRAGPRANFELSRRRINAVTRDMHRHGFDQVEFREREVGVASAEPSDADGHVLRRRVDVSIHLMNHPVH